MLLYKEVVRAAEGVFIQHRWKGLHGGTVSLGGGGIGYLGNWRVISRGNGRGARVSNVEQKGKLVIR
jgi:hypothetical protein